MTNPNLVALVPMKPLSSAKKRLRPILSKRERAALSLLMLDHVLGTLAASAEITETRVVGGDRWVRELCRKRHASWKDDRGATLNPALEEASRDAYAEGAAAVLIVPADLGLIEPGDIHSMVEASAHLRRVSIAQAARDTGTNALLAPRDLLPPLKFGRGSFPAHTEACAVAEFPFKTVEAPGIAFDLDTPYGFEIYRAARPALDTDLDRWQRLFPADTFQPQTEEATA